MTMLRTLLLAVGIAAGLTGAPALADRPHPDRDRDTRSERTSPEREQQSVLEATREGREKTRAAQRRGSLLSSALKKSREY